MGVTMEPAALTTTLVMEAANSSQTYAHIAQTTNISMSKMPFFSIHDATNDKST
jgi:hypothetical protein